MGFFVFCITTFMNHESRLRAVTTHSGVQARVTFFMGTPEQLKGEES
jgi:hypothetical protein